MTEERNPVAGVDRNGTATIVRLAGELDLYNAPLVREALLGVVRERPARLVVDLGEVEFLDSTALGVLVEASGELEDRRAFALAAPGAETRRALEVSGLDTRFSVFGSVDEALAAGA